MATFRNITCESSAGVGTATWPTTTLILPCTLEVTGEYCNLTPSINANIAPTGALALTSGTPGTMDNVAIGGTTPLAAKVTTLTTTGNIELGHASDTTIARSGAGDATIEGNAIYRAGGTDVPVTDGGTGSSTASGARTNLGVVRYDVVFLEDRKTQGTNGGTSSSGWNDRTINTEVADPSSLCTINADNIRFELAAGTWEIEWCAPVGYANRYGSKLVNTTDTTDVAMGTSNYAASTGATGVSFGRTYVTIASAKEFKVQTHHQTGAATEGLGSCKTGSNGSEVYTQVRAVRLLE